jgi:hypothetical protein
VSRARVTSYFCVTTLLACPVGHEGLIPIIISLGEHQDNIHNESRVARGVHRHDSQCGVLANIISNAIKSAFSEFAQQQRHEEYIISN